MRGLCYAALISALTVCCLAQSGPTPKLVLDNAKPIVYIELDHIGPRPPVEGDEPDRGLWLRLVNNSVVPVEVQTMGTSTDPELTLVPDEIVGRWTRIEESDAPEPKGRWAMWPGTLSTQSWYSRARGCCSVFPLLMWDEAGTCGFHSSFTWPRFNVALSLSVMRRSLWRTSGKTSAANCTSKDDLR
jgi:hypothetical protein